MNVTDWLLDSDPAIRWQVMRDLTDAPDEDVAAERAKVAREGWGAAVLAAQRADGSWAGGAYAPGVDVDDVQPPAAARRSASTRPRNRCGERSTWSAPT